MGEWPNGPTAAVRAAVVLGGALGTLLRVAIADLPAVAIGGTGTALPVGTLAANLTGSLLLGWLAGRLGARRTEDRWLPVTAGFAGAATTFSTFAVEATVLLERHPLTGILWLVGSIGVGLAAVAAGRRLGRSSAPSPATPATPATPRAGAA